MGQPALTGVVALETPDQVERPGSGDVSVGGRGYARAAAIRPRSISAARGCSSTPPASTATVGSRLSRAAARRTGHNLARLERGRTHRDRSRPCRLVRTHRRLPGGSQRGDALYKLARSGCPGQPGPGRAALWRRSSNWRLQAWVDGSQPRQHLRLGQPGPEHGDAGQQPVCDARHRCRTERRAASRGRRLRMGDGLRCARLRRRKPRAPLARESQRVRVSPAAASWWPASMRRPVDVSDGGW